MSPSSTYLLVWKKKVNKKGKSNMKKTLRKEKKKEEEAERLTKTCCIAYRAWKKNKILFLLMLCSLNTSTLTEANQQIVAMLSLIWVFCLTHVSANVSVPSPAPPSSASFSGANGRRALVSHFTHGNGRYCLLGCQIQVNRLLSYKTWCWEIYQGFMWSW